MSTTIMPITDLRRDTRAVIDAVQESGEAIYITKNGRPAVVLVDYEQYEALISAKKDEWPPNYFEETYGSFADDPLVREEQEPFPKREMIL